MDLNGLRTKTMNRIRALWLASLVTSVRQRKKSETHDEYFLVPRP